MWTLKQCQTLYQQIKRWAQKNRLWILLLAACVFLGGIIIAVRYLGLNWSDISFGPVLIILLLTAPISACFNSFELRLCARATGNDIMFLDALRIVTTATIANILPVPASFAIRGAALVSAGATIGAAGRILFIAGLMWLSLASAVSGVAIFSGALAILIGAGGLFGSFCLALWISKLSTVRIALGFILIRVIMLGILVVQLKLCFAAIGQLVSLPDAAVYAVSGVIAAVVAIVPAGLGLTEGFGALLAEIAGASPSAAFLSLSLNRIFALSVTGCIALGLGFWMRPKPALGEEK